MNSSLIVNLRVNFIKHLFIYFYYVCLTGLMENILLCLQNSNIGNNDNVDVDNAVFNMALS